MESKDMFFKEGNNGNILIKRFNFKGNTGVFDKLKERYPIEDFTADSVKKVKMVDNKAVVSAKFKVGNCDDSHPSYIKIPLYNKEHGNIEGKLFKKSVGNIDDILREFDSMKVGSVIGKYNEFPKGSGKFSIIVTDIIQADGDFNELDFCDYISDDNILEIHEEFLYYLSKISGDEKEFVMGVLDKVWDLYKYAPASKKNHHNYVGGLLQHTTEVTRIAYLLGLYISKGKEEFLKYLMLLNRASNVIEFNIYNEEWKKAVNKYSSVSSKFNKQPLGGVSELIKDMGNRINLSLVGKDDNKLIDISLLLSGAILHDIGKILEYTYPKDKELNKYEIFFGKGKEYNEGNINDVDTLGKRLGHIVIGEMLCHKEYTTGNYKLSIDRYTDILSLISTHHMKLEWGSPTVPETTEELVLHLADNIDAKISYNG